jgi:type II secretory pathway component PulL
MKLLLLIALLFVGCQGAVAQSSEYSTVRKASDRLACYDRATPPSVAKPIAAKQKAAASNTSPEQISIVDGLAIENAKLDARLKTICRGC